MKAFVELKTALTSMPLVSFLRKDHQYALIMEASCGDDVNPGGMGAILTQVDDKTNFYVIAYASRKLLKHEKNYTLFLLEMHAAVWGMEYFSHHLKGRRFLLFTNHKPMENLGKVHTKTLYRIQEAMLQYDFEIHYQKGAEMPADYLSRNIASIHDLISDRVVATAQQGDPHLQAILAYLKHGTVPPNKDLKQLITHYGFRCFIDKDLLWIRLFDNNLGHRSLIMVPDSLRHRVISQYHNSWFGGHEGVHKTVQRMQLYRLCNGCDIYTLDLSLWRPCPDGHRSRQIICCQGLPTNLEETGSASYNNIRPASSSKCSKRNGQLNNCSIPRIFCQ
jgi:hypothetical protein